VGSGLRLQVSMSAVDALKVLRESEGELPDLLILDLNLPGMNGFELLGELRKDSVLAEVPVLVFSSSQHEKDVRRAYAEGANGYLMKPLDFTELVEVAATVDEMLRSRDLAWDRVQELACYRLSN
jgi:DNA-binding response OmpR family regulator